MKASFSVGVDSVPDRDAVWGAVYFEAVDDGAVGGFGMATDFGG